MKTVRAASIDNEKDFFEVTVLEVVEQMPSLMLVMNGARAFPSLIALNDLFSIGKCDDGMSGGVLWEVFTLSPDCYNDLKTSISLKYGINFREIPELNAKDKYDDWIIKALEYCGLSS